MNANLERGAWRHDLLASIVVFLVALPLCMGIAIASGVPPEKAAAVGIITGIIGGIVVGLLAGSPLLITGPAAGLSVLVFELVQRFGWERVGLIVLLAGAMQAAAGLCKLGKWFRAVSPAVIHGMLAGIGVLIFISQFHIMLDDKPRGSGLANMAAIPDALRRLFVPVEGANYHHPAAIGLLTVVVLVAWKSLLPKKVQVVPAPLVAVIVATVAAAACGLSVKRVGLPDNLLTAVSLPSFTGLATVPAWQGVVLAAVSIAFIASAETLLSASAVDQMHQGPRTRYDRELFAQGVGNMVSGFVGGLPMTGVIVRSAANVEAGARSNLSEILHGVWLLVFVAAFPGMLRWVPTASLAAILVYTGFKLVDLKVARALGKYGKSELLIYAATVLTIVFTDLLTGVLTGVALSMLKLVATFSRLDVRVHDEPGPGRTTLFLEGNATFINLPKLAEALDAVGRGRELHVHFEHLRYIDHACLDLLMQWEKAHEASGSSLVIDWDSLTARFHEYGTNGNGNGSPAHAGNGNLRRRDSNQVVEVGQRRAPFPGRLLVGLNGQEPDVHLIRYAAMVARLNQPAAGRGAAKLSPAPLSAGADPEVRFVYLFPCPNASTPLRSALRTQVNTYFTTLSERVAIGYDVLKGDALERLSTFAADFDSDLLLLGQSTWSPGTCARIALEAPCPVWLVPPGWAPVLRRLLVPCDFSERSAAALRLAIDIARRSQHAKCLVLHVSATASRFSDAHSRRARERQLKQVYERFLAGIDTHGVAVEPLFVEGWRVDQQIERAADRHGVDLVVVSTRGRTRSARRLLPSVTDLAIRCCPTSFLVLRGADRPVGLVRALWERLTSANEPQFS